MDEPKSPLPGGVPGGNAALRSASLLEELHFYFPSSLVESPPRIPISTERPGEAWEVWKHLPLPSADTTSSSILISVSPESRLRFLACWFYLVKPLQAEREGIWGTPGGAPQNVNSAQQQSKAGLKTAVREVGEPFATEMETYLHLMETSFLQRCRRLSQSGKQEVHIPVDLEPDTKPREQHLSWMLAAW